MMLFSSLPTLFTLKATSILLSGNAFSVDGGIQSVIADAFLVSDGGKSLDADAFFVGGLAKSAGAGVHSAGDGGGRLRFE
jgi:hypothetical protein